MRSERKKRRKKENENEMKIMSNENINQSERKYLSKIYRRKMKIINNGNVVYQ